MVYLPPERFASYHLMKDQASAQNTYDVRSDIWSLGITLAEVAINVNPYLKDYKHNGNVTKLELYIVSNDWKAIIDLIQMSLLHWKLYAWKVKQLFAFKTLKKFMI
uniref:Protein kinase domain-containing protein n=1 Tax=Acrobeloides nanus TaxID=290746 RepID=A0A914D9P6_9BILA